jgi:hypothetical protein
VGPGGPKYVALIVSSRTSVDPIVASFERDWAVAHPF